MNVYIINRELNREKQYQIMTKCSFGFNHVYPGKLFTLEQAHTVCCENGFNVIATGNVWQCL